MYKKYLSCLLLFFSLSYTLQNQNNISIEKNKVNIYGEFNGRAYENILLNNKINHFNKRRSVSTFAAT